MAKIFKLFLLLLLVSGGLLAAVVWFSLAEKPLLIQTQQLSHTDIARAKKIIKQNDPRHMSKGSQHNIRISEKDLNLAGNFLMQKVSQGGLNTKITPGQLQVRGTFHISKLPMRPYVNFELQVTDQNGIIEITQLRLGKVTIPKQIAQFALTQGVSAFNKHSQYELATNTIKQFTMTQSQLHVRYEWDPEIINQARSTLLSTVDTQAIEVYYRRLIHMQNKGQATQGKLIDLLQPMFALAKARSEDGNAVMENTALLSVLATWASGHSLEEVIPSATEKPQDFKLKLQNRSDFGQHFLLSAALAARGSGALSDAIGQFKEVSDSTGSSGFSFTDIAADRAGTRFGTLATQSSGSAVRVQNLLAKGIVEADIMPKTRDLPKPMSASQFKQQFGEVDSERYKKILHKIERRLDNCSLYKGT